MFTPHATAVVHVNTTVGSLEGFIYRIQGLQLNVATGRDSSTESENENSARGALERKGTLV